MGRRAAAVPDYLTFWGKAQPVEPAAVGWHPIAFHCLDVAACVEAILTVRPRALATGGALLGLNTNETISLCVALAALHDIGKFGNSFQAKERDLWPAALGEFALPASSPHTKDGFVLWRANLGPRFLTRLVANSGTARVAPMIQAVFGHHGRPLCTVHLPPVDRLFAPAAVAATVEYVDAVLDQLIQIPVSLWALSDKGAARASWWLSGLLTVADWIGSNQSWFPYTAPAGLSLQEYWQTARERAGAATRGAGLVAPRPAKSFSAVPVGKLPTPAQRWAAETPLPDGQVLVVLEDLTGSGKTEAACILAHRLMRSGVASGVYWAMPTQATANAMYERQHKLLGLLFDDDVIKPSLALAHGQARLVTMFRSTVLGVAAPTTLGASEREPNIDDVQSSAWCSAFLADDRRASLLADVGAGTIDQALLGALPSKFNTIRLFGLSEKVLVIDEAHAYDAYTGTELQRLLSFQAALGGSAIVLSATLTAEKRRALIDAWREGLGERRAGEVSPTIPLGDAIAAAYPLTTKYMGGSLGAVEEAVAAAPWSGRKVDVRFTDSTDAVVSGIADAARGGASVVWVRNTVDSALRAAGALQAVGLNPTVFHARYAQGDRQAREREVLKLFGPLSEKDERFRRVLVATQVIEQSLDLDFDFMVSDLAPIDLLVQRAGRLWRHAWRDPSRPPTMRRELVVLSPPPDEDVTASWLAELLPGTALVYPNGGVLWRSARALADIGAIETPAGLRHLVETVYASDRCPAALQPSADRSEGRERANAGIANYGALRVADGYHGDATAWVDDVKMPTRLGQEQTTIRLGRLTGDRTIEPWHNDGTMPEWKRWALSEVRVYTTRVPPFSEATNGLHRVVNSVRAHWSRFDQDIPVLPLIASLSGVWRGSLTTPAGSEVRMTYTEERGLEFGGK